MTRTRVFVFGYILTLLASCGSVGLNDPESGTSDDIFVSSIELSTHSLTLEKGGNGILRVSYYPSNSTQKNTTWVSSNTSIATVSDGIVVGVATGTTEIVAKCGEAVDKCMVTVVISATCISINQESLTLHQGETETLTATIEPSDATDDIIWETSDVTVATVEGGVVNAVCAGIAKVFVKAGSQKAACDVIVLPPVGAVDLGVVITRNDGSTYKLFWGEQYFGREGLERAHYYAWGEVLTYYSGSNSAFPDGWRKHDGYHWNSYTWAHQEWNKLIKYCPSDKSDYWDGDGTPDNKIVLDMGANGDDVVSKAMGGKWRMPTKEEMEALINQCEWKWRSDGCYIKSKVPGNDNQIYIGEVGMYHYKGNSVSMGHVPGYLANGFWTSTLNVNKPSEAYALIVLPVNQECSIKSYQRYYGMAILAVTE